VRKLVVVMQTTLDGRTSRADGSFWQPFAWGEEETSYLNQTYAGADTWLISRPLYDVVVPYWDEVAAGRYPDPEIADSPASIEFAGIVAGFARVVLSHTLTDDPASRRRVRSGDAVEHVRRLKEEDGADIVASLGPGTLGPLADVPGLVDEYVLVIHPVVLADGPRLFEHVTRDLALTLVTARVFDSGAAVMRYRASPVSDRSLAIRR
jgi:dihydrofolate reductase